MESLEELLAGRFPKGLAELFTAQTRGLFPTPKEIHFHCSRPDWAFICKHVAAVLYGIGTRLDEDPSLFFRLRKVKMEDLIAQAVHERSRKLLKHAGRKTSRVIDDADLQDVFGIEMEPRGRGDSKGRRTKAAKPKPKPKATPRRQGATKKVARKPKK